MHVEVRKVDDVIVVDLEGHLVAGTGDELLRDVMNELIAEGWKKILLNLSALKRIDSAGIGELVGGAKVAERFQSSVRLVHVTGRVRNVLDISQVLPLFHVYDDEQDAVAAFGASEPAAAAGSD